MSFKTQFLSFLVYGLTLWIGVVAFLYPFWLPTVTQNNTIGAAHTADSPLILTMLVSICFIVLLLEAQGTDGMSVKLVATLGILIAINALLRFVEVAIPVPGGFSPIFFLILLTGYVFGGRFGFLMGALTLLVSAFVTGTLGPWLPYQMFTAGWAGMSAALLTPLVKGLGWQQKPVELALLAFFGALWGMLYGFIINIWFWPFAAGSGAQYWAPGLGLWQTMQHYLGFYLATSFLWDTVRAVGNVAFIVLFGAATLRVLLRFKHRFAFEYQGGQ